MDKVTVAQADYQAAEEVVDAANIVSHDGYYEADIAKAANVIAAYRTNTNAELVGALREAVAELDKSDRRSSKGAGKARKALSLYGSGQ